MYEQFLKMSVGLGQVLVRLLKHFVCLSHLA